MTRNRPALAWNSGSQNIMWRQIIYFFNIAKIIKLTFTKIGAVGIYSISINLTEMQAFSTKSLYRQPKSTNACKQVNSGKWHR